MVDAKLNLLWLKRKKVITEDLIPKIENSNHANAKEILFDHLMRNADVAALRMYCKMAIDHTDGLPNMQKLGRKMLNDLPPEGVCVCSRAQHLHCMCYAYCMLLASELRMYVRMYSCHHCLGRVSVGLSTVPRTSSPSYAVLPIHPNI